MDDRKSKGTDEPVIDPALKTTTHQPSDKPPTPASTVTQRRENETDANRSEDGARKRAEEGM